MPAHLLHEFIATKAIAMLAKSLVAASLLALAPIASAQHSRMPPVDPIGLIPYGDLSGAWTSGSSLADGTLTGVMSDVLGRPLWILDASMSDTGAVSGALLPLEYATNPALGLSNLTVAGSSKIDASGSGSFTLVIHEPFGQVGGPQVLPAFRPVVALGTIKGELQSGHLTKLGASMRASAGSTKPLRIGSPRTTQLGSTVQGAGSGIGAASGAQRSDVIEDPWSPGFSVQGIGKPGSAGAQGQSKGLGAAHAASQAGHQVPAAGAGSVVGRWSIQV